MFDILKEKFKSFTESIKKKIDKENTSINSTTKKENEENKKNIGILEKTKLLLLKQEVIINISDIESSLNSLELELLESDIAYEACEEILNDIKTELVGSHKKVNIKIENIIENAIKKSILNILSKNFFDIDEYIEKNKNKFIHILFVGINGTGKTTSLVKLAYYLKTKFNCSVAIAAGDTYRAGAIDQLDIHSKNIDVKLIKYDNRKDPTSVIYDAITYCKNNNMNILLSDTAGRMHTNINLMEQLKKIYKMTQPNLVLFVEDSTAGQDAIERINYFNNSINIDGIILTKLDADTRGGAAVSVSYISKKPIIFVGIGQSYQDLKKFNSEWFVKELFNK